LSNYCFYATTPHHRSKGERGDVIVIETLALHNDRAGRRRIR